MTLHDMGLITFVQAFWVLSLYFLIRLALRRVRPFHHSADWDYETQITHMNPRGNVITLLKIYSKVSRSTPRELAMNIRDELSSNAATFYQKPNAYFVKYRTNDRLMKQYFHDEELRLFFKNPRAWASFNGAIKDRFFGLIKDESNPSDQYYNNLQRIIRKFEDEIAGGKKIIDDAKIR